jgi:hypothetical protein
VGPLAVIKGVVVGKCRDPEVERLEWFLTEIYQTNVVKKELNV